MVLKKASHQILAASSLPSLINRGFHRFASLSCRLKLSTFCFELKLFGLVLKSHVAKDQSSQNNVSISSRSGCRVSYIRWHKRKWPYLSWDDAGCHLSIACKYLHPNMVANLVRSEVGTAAFDCHKLAPCDIFFWKLFWIELRTICHTVERIVKFWT